LIRLNLSESYDPIKIFDSGLEEGLFAAKVVLDF